MNATDTAFFRDLIQQRLAELDTEDRKGKEGQSIVTLDQQSIGRLSRMDALQVQAMAKATQQRRDNERLGLDAALIRLGNGEYGICEDCGDDIPHKRLMLSPVVTRCVTCASG